MLLILQRETVKCPLGLQADVSTKLCFFNRGWAFDLGYNFYFQEKEKVCIKTECPCAIDQTKIWYKRT